MAIFVVYMTVWKTFFTLYCIMLRRFQLVDSCFTSYQVGIRESSFNMTRGVVKILKLKA